MNIDVNVDTALDRLEAFYLYGAVVTASGVGIAMHLIAERYLPDGRLIPEPVTAALFIAIGLAFMAVSQYRMNATHN